jgi:hypothetical protein
MVLKTHVFLLALLVLSQSGLHAQVPPSSDKKLVTEVFEVFFESLRNKDTTTFKSVIYRPTESRWFFRTNTGDHSGLLSSGAGRTTAVIRSVGSEDGLLGKCNNKFDSISVRVYQRYATVNANYQCYIASDSLNHSGTYTIHFLKPDDWKIEQVIRYIDVPDNK